MHPAPDPIGAPVSVLRSSKLQTPRPRRGATERTRLLDALRRLEQPVVLVAAPGGYGKSILASQWTARETRPVAWLHLDDDDNDPVRLVRYLLEALGRVTVVPDELPAELTGPMPRIETFVLPGLLNAVAASGPFLLVLDDVHALREPACLELVAALVDAVPAGAQIALLARFDPGIGTARRHVEGRIAEIPPEDLAFDIDETRRAARAAGWPIDRQTAFALRQRTEGWAAGIVLAAQAMAGEPDGVDRLAGLTGDRVEIAHYLGEVVLGDLDAPRLRFLLETSVLDWMSGPLCDEALEVHGSAERLADLVRSNLFVIPLDPRRDRYRYHHLFQELLRAELERRDPRAAKAVLARAAAWHERHGDQSEAFRYAHEAGDLERAGRVALQAWDRYAGVGRLQTMRLWLDRCTETEIGSDTQLSLAAAWVRMLTGDPAGARRDLARAEQGDLDRPSADGATSLRSAVANARSAIAADGVQAMLRDGAFVIASEGPSRTRWLLGGYRAVGTANVLLGRLEEARVALGEALSLSLDPAVGYVRVYCLGYLALAAADGGDWEAAARWSGEARALVEGRGLNDTLQAILPRVATAALRQQAGSADRAARELQEVERLFPLVRSIPWFAADIAIRAADVHQALGDRARARWYVATAHEALARYPDAGLLPDRLRQVELRMAAGGAVALTPAELRVLPLLPTYLSLQEIADRVGLSRSTIKTQVASIYAKLGVADRSAAVDRLVALGLVANPIPAGDDRP